MELFRLFGTIMIDNQEAMNSISSTASKFEQVGEKMGSIGKSLTTKVTLPIAGIATAAAKLGMDFEAAMSEVGAISGATSEELKQLEEKAREMGATTKFSASESAEALKYMAMAGWETHSMLDGIEGVMMLAAASGENLGTVSDIVTDSLTAFGLKAEDAGHFADVLAKASSSSNTNVSMMGETFKYVAPLAGSLGYSTEDTALAIGLMANAGIKGSRAGTALRSTITRLIKPTKESGTAMDTLGITMTNTDGTMKSLGDVMGDLRTAFAKLDPEQQAFYAAQIAGQEGMSGFLAIVNASDEDYENLRQNINNSTGAAKEMADMMEDNLKGSLTKLKSAMEELGLKIFNIIVPALTKFIEKIQGAVDWFNKLSPGMQKTIVKIAALAAAIGPLLIVSGKVIGSIGTIVGLFGGLSTAGTAAATATTAVGSGFSLAGAAAKAGALLLNPWTIGIAAAAMAGYGLYKHLKNEAIPEVELFGEEVSEATKKAVGGFLELEEQATSALNELAWSGQEVTEETKNNIVGNFEKMKNQVVTALKEQKTEALANLEELFANSKNMTEEEKEEILKITEEKYENQIKKTEKGNERISEILENAKKENRTITEKEKKEILKIKEEMKENGIRLLSETETESLAILERLRQESDTITARQAADVVKNSKEQKEKRIAEAEEEYEKVLKAAVQLKADGTKESEEMANKIIKEAQRQRDEAVKAAEDMHQKIVTEAKEQAKEHVNSVNWETGEIMSLWGKAKSWFANNPIIKTIFTNAAEGKDEIGNPRFRYARGTNYHPGGFAIVGEEGPELINLPRGSKVYSNQKSMEMMGGKMEHSGTIKVVGVNNKDELTGVVDIVMDQLRREVRMA